MKRHSTKTIAIAVLAVLAGSVGLTQTGCKGKSASRSPVGLVADPVHQQLLNEVVMTAEQKQQVRAILMAHEQSVVQWSAVNGSKLIELKAIVGKYHGGASAGVTQEEIQAALSESARLENERRDMDTQLLADLQAALDEQQFAKARGILNPAPPPWAMGPTNKFHFLGQLGLTEQQLGAIRAIMVEARESSELPSDGPIASAEAMEVAWARIVNEALTEENQAQLADLVQRDTHQRMVLAPFSDMNLSADQIAKIQVIWEEAYAAAEAATDPNAKFSIYTAAQGDIVENVLDDEQRAELEGGQGEIQDPHEGHDH